MADYIDITAPVIKSIEMVPNPAQANGKFTALATVTEEVLRRMYPMPFASGEISSGEG